MTSTTTSPDGDFVGAKAALTCGSRLLTLHRDDLPGLPWAGFWDLPGGGREGSETAETCLLRELHEEFGLTLRPARLQRKWVLPSITDPRRPSVFFLGWLRQAEIAQVRFGDEGQAWAMMELADFLSHPKAIPAMQDRVRMALSGAAHRP